MVRAFVDGIETLFANVKQFRRLERLIERADLPIRTGELLAISSGSAFGLGLFSAVLGLSAFVILLLMGPAWGILFNALIYLPFIVWLWKAPYRRKVVPADRRVRALSDVLSTWHAVAGNRVIASMTLRGC